MRYGDNKIHLKYLEYSPCIWNWTSIYVNLAKNEGDLELGWPTDQACLIWTTPNKEATVLLLLYILAGIGQLSQGVPARKNLAMTFSEAFTHGTFRHLYGSFLLWLHGGGGHPWKRKNDQNKNEQEAALNGPKLKYCRNGTFISF